MASSRKRPRASDADRQDRVQERKEDKDNTRAECPFRVIVDPVVADKKKKNNNNKRRRTAGGKAESVDDEDADPADKLNFQQSPFHPSGKFRTYPNLDVNYKVEPAKDWTDMTRYNSFVLNNVKYYAENFIYVANDLSIKKKEPKPQEGNDEAAAAPITRRDTEWVARILEIRARDEHHVFARVYWMYWPDELPAKTRDRKRIVQGRQPYHGQGELVASNHMDIINVVSVTEPAIVKHWFEENDEETQDSLYWRQAYDIRSQELSTVELVCGCNTPANPDKLLVGCSSESCKKWLHEECIKDQALRATFERLGTDKPHVLVKEEKVEKVEKEEEADDKQDAKVEPNGDAKQEESVDVKAEKDASQTNGGTNGNRALKAGSEDAKPAPEDTPEAEADEDEDAQRQGRGIEVHNSRPDISTRIHGNGNTNDKNGRRAETRPTPQKVASPPGSKVTNKDRPWEGLFSVTLEMNGQPYLEFTDLRADVLAEGGAKTWTEPIKCLVCGVLVN
ncbi:unnamed protein product [Sordaria macrospora k-hell]|uniref:WGS project CABT00000000 data, contig 2.50 n=1 Tax=Sordaria macrospora (strain ATCC MYA-333 / DSM 997 / K(L3346) / K-hell) TaxID=771870 RepID=F7W9A4_SORMK|nr:uncharacterized protein SMAC_08051 [Sordaria macrospora k-hell]CCC05184.1 unnamed protein product [Sordaria macrospora k-hell]